MPSANVGIENTPGSSRRVVTIVTTLAGFLISFMGMAVNIAVPKIGSELQMTAVALGWVSTSFFLSSAALLVPVGRLADLYGRKRFFIIGVIALNLGSLLAIFAQSATLFISARIVQGVAASMIHGTGIPMMAAAYPATERGRALGINSASSFLGMSLGPWLGGLLTDQLGWRSIFVASFISSLAIVAIVIWKLRSESSVEGTGRFDYGGSVIFAIMLIAIIYGLSSLPGIQGAILLLCGLGGSFLFALWESRSASPLLDLSLLKRNRTFLFSNVATLIIYATTFAVGFLLSLYLQSVKHLSSEMAGLVLVTVSVVQFPFAPIAGRLSDRIEPRKLASAGMAVTVVGLVMLIFVSQTTSIFYIVVSLFIQGLGSGLFVAPNTNAIMTSAGKNSFSLAAAMMATSRQVGAVLSMGIAMLVFAIFIGPFQITPERYDALVTSIRTALIIFSILCLLGVFASLARGNIRKTAGSDL